MTDKEISSILADIFECYTGGVLCATTRSLTMREAGLHSLYDWYFVESVKERFGVVLSEPIGRMPVSSVCDIIRARVKGVHTQFLIDDEKRVR